MTQQQGQMTQQHCQSTEGSSSPKDRLQSHEVHLTVLQYYTCMQCAVSLVSLEVLELRDNLIRFLPPSLGSLTRLQSLDLGSNLIDIVVR